MQQPEYCRFYSPTIESFFKGPPFEIKQFKNYFPLYSYLFPQLKMNMKNVCFKHRYHLIRILEKPPSSIQQPQPSIEQPSSRIFYTIVYDHVNKKHVKRRAFVKCCNILEPCTFVKNKYGEYLNSDLITYIPVNNKLNHKLYFQYNNAYVESLATYLLSYLSEKYIVPHFPLVYGIYNGIPEHYLTEFTAEFNDMKYTPSFQKFYREGKFDLIGTSSTIDVMDVENNPEVSAVDLTDLEELDFSYTKSEHHLWNHLRDKDTIYLDMKKTPCQIIAIESFTMTFELFIKQEIDIHERLWNLYFIEQDPIQKQRYRILIFLKKSLFEKKFTCFLLQITMALICVQHHYQLCHNDLHTQNIMLQKTKKKLFYYCVGDQYFQVPTYGYVVKIIDFGRSTYRFRGNFYIGDIFKYCSEAGEQYSYPHSHYKNKKQISPNFSFDLCRLACSLLEDMFILQEPKFNIASKFIPMFKEWVTDKYNKSILRYCNFDLYKMIARRCRKAIPIKQISRSMFQRYKIQKENIPSSKEWIYYVTRN